MPTIVLAELYAWANLRSDPSKLLTAIERDLLQDVQLLDFDRECAAEYGRVRIQTRKIGITVAAVDLWIASVALAHDLTLVTNNTKDFENIPGLRLEDWLTP